MCYIAPMRAPEQRQRVVAYYRVSTQKQGESGLGLAAQETAVNAYVAGIDAKVIATYTEIESGRKADRPKLAAALAHAKRARATLVIAKLDRLSRNVAFLANLMESGVDFIACDNPHATRLTIHILAAVAEEEARAISDRTKKALAAAKARGTTKTGRSWTDAKTNANLTAEARARGSKVGTAAIVANKREAYAFIVPIIADMKAQNPELSLRAIATELNAMGELTRNGSAWTAVQVARVLKLAAA